MDQGLVVGLFGVGAYQQMIAPGAAARPFRCLNPEMRRIIIEQDDDALVVREVAPGIPGHDLDALGYAAERLEPLATLSRRQSAAHPARAAAGAAPARHWRASLAGASAPALRRLRCDIR
ncbi:MAG: hypothetical protein U0Z44_19835 [Kouleothrix sp.]